MAEGAKGQNQLPGPLSDESGSLSKVDQDIRYCEAFLAPDPAGQRGSHGTSPLPQRAAQTTRAETPTLPHSPTAHPSQLDRPTVTEIRREQVHTIKRGHLPRTKKHRSLRMDLRMFSRTIVGGTLLPLLPCDEQNDQRQCACAVRSWRVLWPSARFEDCKPKAPRQASSTAVVAPALWALVHPTATSWTSGEAAARRGRALMVRMLLQLLVGEAEHRSACLPCPLLTSARRS